MSEFDEKLLNRLHLAEREIERLRVWERSLTTATPTASAVPKADAGGKLAVGWMPDLTGTYLPLGGTAVDSENSDTVDGAHASATPTANAIPKADGAGKLAVGWLPASATPTASTIPIADAGGKLAIGWTSGALHMGAAAGLTIASGSVTVSSSSSFYRVETEGGAAADDLTAIVGGAAGQILILRTENSAHDVTVVDGGVLFLAGNFAMANSQHTLTLIKVDATNWFEISRSAN